MKYFLLQANKEFWFYDCVYSFVVYAILEKHARIIASQDSGDEGKQVWLFSNFSTCEELNFTGEARIILRDYNAG